MAPTYTDLNRVLAESKARRPELAKKRKLAFEKLQELESQVKQGKIPSQEQVKELGDTKALLSILEQDEYPELPKTEYYRYGDHFHVMDDNVDMAKTLEDLAVRGGKFPIQYLHVYCHTLQGLPNNELHLRITDRGISLRSADIFTPEPENLSRIIIEGADGASFNLRLYYEYEYGPESFWVNAANDKNQIHVIRDESIRAKCKPEICDSLKHVVMNGAIGLKLSQQGGRGISSVELIYSVPVVQLVPLGLVDFERDGADVRRLHNLPRLLEHLFTSAGKQLVQSDPNYKSIISKLRFVQSCSKDAGHLGDLIKATNAILGLIEIPYRYFTPNISRSLRTTGGTAGPWFFVPDEQPHVLKEGMSESMKNLTNLDDKIRRKEEMNTLRKLIRDSQEKLYQAIKETIDLDTTKLHLGDAENEALDATRAAKNKLDELKNIKNEVSEWASKFQKGMEEYQRQQKAKYWTDLVKSVISSGVAIFTTVASGGVTFPALLDVAGNLYSAVEKVSEIENVGSGEAKLSLGVVAIWEAFSKLLPKLIAAAKENDAWSKQSLAKAGDRFADRAAGVQAIGTAADDPKETTDQADFPGLKAQWRDLDVATEVSFRVIRDSTAGSVIDGLDEYYMANKKLINHGEILVEVLKTAHDARRRYLLVRAEKKVKESMQDEIKSLHDKVLRNEAEEAFAYILIKHRLVTELNSQRQRRFQDLFQGVLSLVYRNNDIKIPSRDFETLSPDSPVPADENGLLENWSTFSKMASSSPQLQTGQLNASAAQVCLSEWKQLLTKYLEFPFQVPLTHIDLQNYYNIRIRNISVEFKDLQENSGEPQSIKYKVIMGPELLDKAPGPSGNEVTYRYYRGAVPLVKKGKNNRIINGNKFSRPTVGCKGIIQLNKEDMGGTWDLSRVTDLSFEVDFEAASAAS